MEVTDLTIWLALGAGFLSFISPCNLPLYPSFLSYITGVSVEDLRENKGILNRKAMLHTLFFILGFSVIFFALGLSACFVGSLFQSNQQLISQLGAVFIVVMGLAMLGIYQPKWMMQEKRFNLGNKPIGYLGSSLIGVSYAAGWMPCVGPILTAVLTVGVTQPDKAVVYIIAYIIGFAIPFFMMAFFIGKTKWIQKYS